MKPRPIWPFYPMPLEQDLHSGHQTWMLHLYLNQRIQFTLWQYLLQWSVSSSFSDQMGSKPTRLPPMDLGLFGFDEHHRHVQYPGSWSTSYPLDDMSSWGHDGLWGRCMSGSYPWFQKLCCRCVVLISYGCHPVIMPWPESFIFQASMRWVGGGMEMNLAGKGLGWQPKRLTWSLEHLENEWVIFRSSYLDKSTQSTYKSGLNSYLTFCEWHNFDINPTVDTLSFFITYMAWQTGPSGKLITSYLSGIAFYLKPSYPHIHDTWKHPLILQTIQGVEKKVSQPIKQRLPIEDLHLQLLLNKLKDSEDLDNRLFLVICFTAYHGLMWIGKLVIPDDHKQLNFRKVILCQTVKVSMRNSLGVYEFNLPTSKSNQHFYGNSVIIQAHTRPLDPLKVFSNYLSHQDQIFPFFPQLWLQELGLPPLRSWLLCKLHTTLPSEYSGHSFRARGTTHLAEVGVLDNKIQAMGHWSSETWWVYVHKNPVILIMWTSIPKSIFN